MGKSALDPSFHDPGYALAERVFHYTAFGIALLVTVAIASWGLYERHTEYQDAVRDLTSASESAREHAARELGRYRDATSAVHLHTALTDRSPKVRSAVARALHETRKDMGPYEQYLWHVVQMDDVVEVRNDAVELTRRFQFQVSIAYDYVREISIFLPPGVERVLSVQDHKGRSEKFSVSHRYPLKVLRVEGISKASSGSVREFTLRARLRSVLTESPTSTSHLRLAYSPGHQLVPVREHSVVLRGPKGMSVDESTRANVLKPVYSAEGNLLHFTWKSEGIEPKEQKSLRFEAELPTRSWNGDKVTGKTIDTIAELNAAGRVALFTLIIGGIYLSWILTHYRRHWRIQVICVASLWGVIVFFQPMLIEDTFTYYSYARSAVFDGDFNFHNEYLLLNSNRFYTYGIHEIPSPSGPAILWVPFIWIGHLAAKMVAGIGIPTQFHGYSIPYLFVTAAGGYLMTLASMVLSFRLACRYTSANAALWATLLVTFGTNLLLIAYAWTGSSFQPSVFLFTVFLYYWHETVGRRSWYGWVLIGLLGGLMLQVRYQNGLLLILPFLESVYLLTGRIVHRQWRAAGLLVRDGVVFLLAATIAFGPQLAIFKAMKGQTIIDTYRVSEEGRFNWKRIPHAVTGMFWYGHTKGVANGYFNGSPVLIGAAIGMFLLLLKSGRRAAAMVIALVLQILITASYETWYGKLLYIPSFYLTTCAPIFVIGLAKFLHWSIRSWRSCVVWTAALGSACLWNIYNCYLQLAFKQVTPYPDSHPFLQGLHTLIFQPQPKFQEDYVAISGHFGYILRGLAHGLNAWNGIEFITALTQILLFIPFVLLVSHLAHRVADEAGSSQRTSAVRSHAFFGVLIAVLAVLFTYQTAENTDLSFSYFRRRLISNPESPTVQWGHLRAVASKDQSIIQKFSEDSFGKPKTDYYLIGYLRGATNVEEGAVFGELQIRDSKGADYEADLIVGKHAVDIECPSPSKVSTARHTFTNARAVNDWLLRDANGDYYWSHLTVCHVYFADAIMPSRIQIRMDIEGAEYVLTGIRVLQIDNDWGPEFRKDVTWMLRKGLRE